jgi:Tfp pilus assembly protein PilO
MSQQPVTSRLPGSRERFRVQLDQFRRAHRRGMFGIAEILGLAGGVVMLVVVIVGYFYFLQPARSRVASLLLDRDRLQKQLRFTREDADRGLDTKATVQKITESLAKFEDNGLVERNEGRMILYEELNQLIHKNGLRNTSGPTYTALEPLGSKNQEQATAGGAKSAAAKWQSIYPGIAVNVTIEGQYQNLRHFVRDIESSKQFIIINAVELERATESNALPTTESGPLKSGSGSALVSLRLDMATYFQRAGGATETGPEQTSGEH